MLATINNIVYSKKVKSNEFKRWLAAQGAVFKPGKGSHLKIYLNGRQSVLPMRNAELENEGKVWSRPSRSNSV